MPIHIFETQSFLGNFTVSSQLVTPNGHDLFAIAPLALKLVFHAHQQSGWISSTQSIRQHSASAAISLDEHCCCEHFLPNVESLPAVAQ